MSTTIESLELEVKQNGNSAVQGIDALSASLTRLKSATKGGMGLTSVTTQIRNLNTALSSTDSSSIDRIDKLANSLGKLKTLGNVKISSSIANQLRNIGKTALSLNEINVSGISKIATAVSSLDGIKKSTGLQSAITQLRKIPDLAQTLNSLNWEQFTSNIKKLADSLTPLATKLNTVSVGFSKLPANIQQVAQSTNTISSSNNKASHSYVNIWAKMKMVFGAAKTVANVISEWITKSNEYIEDLNLFTVSLGDYADEAKEYADKVSELLGIDPAEWLRNQGVFNTIIKGFGVASDKAIIMSKNLTQLGYDISSFYNISTEDAFTKLQSGIAGELEPLRRLGYDLSVARLQQEAYNLGIQKSISSMTQAEKSQLRYYAILTQVKDAQGDMARTLTAPANQLRILQAQVGQCSRALGNIFIPVLNAILPYAIAVAKVIRLIADSIAKLFGFSLPDMSSISEGTTAIANAAEDTQKGLNGAAKAAKKLKGSLLGTDELNIIGSDSNGSGFGGAGGSAGGSGFDIDLPEYNFLGEAIDSKVNSIVEKIKEKLADFKKIFNESGVTEAFNELKEAMSNFAQSDLAKTLENILSILLESGFTSALNVVRDIFITLAGILNGDLKQGLTGFKNLIADITFDPLIGLSKVIDSILGTDLAGWMSEVKKSIENIDISKLDGFEKLQGAFQKISKSFEKLKTGIANFIQALDKSGILDAIQNFITWFFSTSFDVTLKTIGTTLTVIADTMAIIGDILNGDTDAALNDFKNLLTTTVLEPLSNIAGVFDSIFGTDVEGWLNDVETSIKNFDLGKWLSDARQNVSDFFTEKIPQFWEDLKDAFQNPKISIKDLWDKILKPIKEFDWKQFGKDVGKNVGEFVKQVGTSLETFFNKTLPDAWETVKTSFKTFFSETLPKFFKETIPELWKTIKEDFKKFFSETLPNTLSDIGQWFEDVGQSIWDGIVEGWNTALDAISDFIDGFVDGFKEALGIHSPSTVFRDEIGEDLGKGLLNGLAKPFESISEWVRENIIDPISKAIDENPLSDLVVKIKNTASDWWNNAKTWWDKAKGDLSISAFVSLIKQKWSSVASWVQQSIGGVVNKGIGLAKNAWTTVADWVKDFIGGAVTVTVNLVSKWKDKIKEFFGLSGGGVITSDGGITMFASGGIIGRNGTNLWDSIPKYGNGTSNAHGSMFIAGENGAEIVGHINGTTEVLNRFQMGQIMHSSIVAGMAQFLPIWRTFNSTLVASTNAIIRSILVSENAVNTTLPNRATYDPSSFLYRPVYEESDNGYDNSHDDSSIEQALYRAIVDTGLINYISSIDDSARKTADKELTLGRPSALTGKWITQSINMYRKVTG